MGSDFIRNIRKYGIFLKDSPFYFTPHNAGNGELPISGMHLYQHGMDLTLISQWLGHASLETTLVYAYADTEAKRKAIEKAMGPGTGVPEDSSNYTIDDEDLLKQLYGL